jgi:diaminopimelate epimerase
MDLNFYKYQGCGNDFVMIDNRLESFNKESIDLVSRLCNRHFGIGADGLILIENDSELDFKMIYFNADGSQTFCGNGGRCAVSFAHYLKIIDNKTEFTAFDGVHFAEIENGNISLKMNDVSDIQVHKHSIFLNTGTQHHVELVANLAHYDVFNNGRKIRNTYDAPGSNVNFVQQINDTTFQVRTYEKGVENETLACGTGVTAVALAMHKIKKTKSTALTLPVKGGTLKVSFTEKKGHYNNVFLQGPATFVYKGKIEI